MRIWNEFWRLNIKFVVDWVAHGLLQLLVDVWIIASTLLLIVKGCTLLLIVVVELVIARVGLLILVEALVLVLIVLSSSLETSSRVLLVRDRIVVIVDIIRLTNEGLHGLTWKSEMVYLT
jgi:hypothetical protein